MKAAVWHFNGPSSEWLGVALGWVARRLPAQPRGTLKAGGRNSNGTVTFGGRDDMVLKDATCRSDGAYRDAWRRRNAAECGCRWLRGNQIGHGTGTAGRWDMR